MHRAPIHTTHAHTQTLFQVMDIFVAEAGKRGILIMFDLHQIDPMKGFDPVRVWHACGALVCWIL